MNSKVYFIYKYTFPNGKVYIGQTYKGSGRYGNPKKYYGTMVGNAMNKYLSFKKEIIKFCTKDEVDYWERFFIDEYQSNLRTKGYNRDSGGNNGKEFSKELKGELSNAHKNLQITSVLQYEKNGLFVKEWHSIKDASKTLGIERTNISKAIHEKTKSAGGFVWKAKETYNPKIKRPIEQYSLDGKFIREWDNTELAENELKIKDISRALRGRNKTAGGYQWKYASDDKAITPFKTLRVYQGRHVFQYDKSGKFVKEWQSSFAAGKALEIPHQHIDRVLKGSRKMTHGFIFTYTKEETIQPYNEDTKSFYKPVIQFSKDGKFIKEWPSIVSAERELNIHYGIGKCCNKKAKTAGGYKWCFKEFK